MARKLNKTSDKMTMNQAMARTQSKGKYAKMREEATPYKVVTEQEIQERDLYNSEGIHEISEKYRSFTPATGILVRAFARGYSEFLGSTQEYAPKVAVMNKAMAQRGQGVPTKYVNDPYPFAYKAVVVSMPEGMPTVMHPGDIVQITGINTVAPDPGNSSFLLPQHFFIHADAEDVRLQDTPPTDMKDEHFGYFLIPANKIIGIISKAEKDEDSTATNG